MTPPTGAATSNRNVRLVAMLLKWAEANGHVAFDSNGGFRLSDTSIVSPDGSLVSDEMWSKLTAKQREGFFPGPPLVAIELCSHSDSPLALRKKLVRLRRAGTAYVVLIDPYDGVIWTDGVAPEAFDLDFEQLLS